jgi:hypothetical protein
VNQVDTTNIFPSICDIGTVCKYDLFDVPVLILDVSKLDQWVDVMLPNGKIQSVSPWQCKKL